MIVERCGARRELLRPNVAAAAKLCQEVLQVSAFGKPGELRGVIEPHIDQHVNPVDFDQSEKLLRALFGVADGEEVHVILHPVPFQA